MANALVGVMPLRDVAEIDDEVGLAAVRVVDAGAVEVDPDDPSIFSHEAQLDVERLDFSANDALAMDAVILEVVGMNQLLDVHRQQFLFGVAKEFAESGRDFAEKAIHGDHRRHDQRKGLGASQTVAHLSQLLFFSAALRDVLEVDGQAVRRWVDPVLEPPIPRRVILLDLDALLRRHRLFVGQVKRLSDALREFGPDVPSNQGVAVAAEDLSCFLIDIDVVPVAIESDEGVGDPLEDFAHASMRRFGGAPGVTLAFRQNRALLFRLAQLGDVATDADQAPLSGDELAARSAPPSGTDCPFPRSFESCLPPLSGPQDGFARETRHRSL